jgi:pyrimidine operon attenuation protein/uracil phosphoribosyltransferase
VLRKLAYGSCYVYCPQGRGAISERSRVLCTLLKSRDPAFIYHYAARVAEEVRERNVLQGFFDAAALLIPVPGCAPRSARGIWVAEHLARALFVAGLGAGVWAGLRRDTAVCKSATAVGGKRPTVAAHYASFGLLAAPEQVPVSILLVDDVVTKGRTLLAAATRVREAFPETPIRAFTLLRTLGMVAEIERLMDPCVGTIRWRAGDAHRSP